MKIVGIIPARLESSRFPNKPLAKILGRTMIEHVYQRSRHAQLIDKIYVATCNKEIADEVKRFGGEAVMTSPNHTRGTDRVAEAAALIEADIIINIQGDEPMICPESLDQAAKRCKENPAIQCLNLVCPITEWANFISPNVVKTVVTPNGKVLYFSRQPIPHTPKEKFRQAIKQMGIYLFRKEFLLSFSKWLQTPLEQIESIDLMRIIENGHQIDTQLTKDTIGVDTTQDLVMAERALTNDAWHHKVFPESIKPK